MLIHCVVTVLLLSRAGPGDRSAEVWCLFRFMAVLCSHWCKSPQKKKTKKTLAIMINNQWNLTLQWRNWPRLIISHDSIEPFEMISLSHGKDISVVITSVHFLEGVKSVWWHFACSVVHPLLHIPGSGHNKQLKALTKEILVYLQQTHNTEVRCIARCLL